MLGARPVLDTGRDDEELAGAELDRTVGQVDRERAVEDEEEIVGVRVRVPTNSPFALPRMTLLPL